MSLAPAKDPVKQRAGSIGAAKRWAGHERRVVRMAELPEPERRVILALIEASKSAPES